MCSSRPLSSLLIIAFALLGASCLGDLGDAPGSDPDGPPGPGDPAIADVAPTVVRRLTRAEYRNTLRDLFAVAPPDEAALPEDARRHGFRTTSDQPLSVVSVAKYVDAAGQVRSALESEVARLFPCAAEELACLRTFLATEGTRIFRRPLRTDEHLHYEAVFTALRVELTFEESALTVIEAMLVAPQFLFLLEERPEGVSEGRTFALDDWQLATRLSYALWQTTPDRALQADAAAGTLSEPDTFRAHAARLVDDPRVHDTMRAFFTDWLALDALDHLAESPDDGLTPEVVADLQRETRAHVEHAFFEGDDTLGELLVSTTRHRSGLLSTFYGDSLASGDALVPVTAALDAQSFGLFSQAGFLATRSPNPQTAIIHRGRFLRERFLCQQLPPPPPGAAGALPMLTPDMTQRTRIETHTGDPSCQACHSRINGLGFALESFDARGRWQTEDNGHPIDARAEIADSDLGTVDGAYALSRALAESDDVRACALEQLFRFTRGRDPEDADRAALEALEARDERNFVALFLALTDDDSFHLRSEFPEVSP